MKNIYELLNNAEIDLNEYENQKLSDYENNKLKRKISKEIKKMNKKKFKWKTSVAAACLCTVIGLGTVSVMAGIFPIPDSIKKVFGINSTQQLETANNMGTALNISDENSGYKITAIGVLRDSKHISVTYRIEKADGGPLDKDGRNCTKADFWGFDTNDSWKTGEVDTIEQEYNPYYIEYFTTFNYDDPIGKQVEMSLSEIRLWFDHEEEASVEVNGEWKFSIPTDIEDSSINLGKGQKLKFGKNEAILDELRISPMGYYFKVNSSDEFNDNEIIKAVDGWVSLYLKNGEKIDFDGGGGPIDNGDGTWSFRIIGTFDKLISLKDMDKIVVGNYEFLVR